MMELAFVKKEITGPFEDLLAKKANRSATGTSHDHQDFEKKDKKMKKEKKRKKGADSIQDWPGI